MKVYSLALGLLLKTRLQAMRKWPDIVCSTMSINVPLAYEFNFLLTKMLTSVGSSACTDNYACKYICKASTVMVNNKFIWYSAIDS